jgi:C4-type Zn-finger protein
MTIKRRLGKWRPVGAVDCPRCGETKPSGGYQYVTDHTNMSTEQKLMCDSCRQRFKSWYDMRSDESGIVVIDA